MKKLKSTEVTIKEFELLSSSLSPRQLFRVAPHQYIVALLDRPTEVIRIESSALTNVVNELAVEISDVTIVEMATPERADQGQDTPPNFELRLHLEMGHVAVIDSNDHVCMMIPMTYDPAPEIPTAPVRDIWTLPDEYPFSHLQITNELFQQIKPVIKMASPAEVLNRMWLDYQCVSKDLLIKPFADRITEIQGEFGSFRVIEHPCGKATLTI